MTPSERRGLQQAKDLLRRAYAQLPIVRSDLGDDLLAAVEWIARQERIDENRRGPRKHNLSPIETYSSHKKGT